MYSIWLFPDKIATERFQKVIESLSESHQSSIFKPHITLLSGIQAVDDLHYYKISVLAALTPVFDVSIGECSSTNLYFKALFLNIKPNESLNKLQSEVAAIFSAAAYEFTPHLSLLYADLKEDNASVEVSKEVFANMFQASSIAIVETQGEVEDWKIVESFPLHQKDEVDVDEVVRSLAITN